MSIVVETGSGKTDAESYCSVEFATQYHSARGNTGWADLVSDTIREQCLRKATEYMVQVYRDLWRGERRTDTQALDWPRENVYLDNGSTYITIENDVVPLDVQKACAELALKASASTLYADQSRGIVSEKIGPLETTYDQYSPQAVRYKAVDSALAPYFDRSGQNQAVRR